MIIKVHTGSVGFPLRVAELNLLRRAKCGAAIRCAL